ncbi:MAG TPA: HU family DNA-binding protein [Acidobacteriota bacterium]|jgi:DNA-binding protein HU-beta|nr:HU family DNA-binding protein [Acidobacteriota bacterium]HNU00459.1 HU family DNA-binding protein [Acidobacteriota bacterium]HPB27244.1 HU family DNA-binding protein [Acidobacteriota bacterium]HQO24536.1 HU family DNA-binding protein [Acidobacteriota bacterium]HQP72407.1 HU family DNA-binding protein [Acidobacteriota bacterium]
MNKADLIKKMSNDADITQTQATKAFNSIIEGVAKELSKNRRVTIVGFGTFSVSHRKARIGRNPKTGAPLKIAARKVPKFTPGKALKDRF